MKKSFYAIGFIAVLFFTASLRSASAQSTDRDNPTPLTSSEITGSFIDHQRDNNKENFYSFTAGPGELTIVFDVKRHRIGDMASISFELLERNGSTALLCCEGAQSGEGGTGRETAKVKLARRQTVILHITNASIGGGSFDARFSGAGMSVGGSDNGGGSNEDRDNEQGSGNRRGDPITVPESGTLHIRMKDGTSQDIDLRRVRNISVRQ